MIKRPNKRIYKKDTQFNMRMDREERKQYEELVETHDFGTLAGLIWACLQAAIRDPTILNPTLDPELKGVPLAEYELLSAVNSSTETLQALVEKPSEEIEKNPIGNLGR